MIHRQIHQPVTEEVQRDLFARAQRHRAEAGSDGAFVAYFGSEQCDITASGGSQRALIDHGSRGTVPEEGVFAGEEVSVRQAHGGGHQTAYIHLGVLTEKYAVGVEQEYLAVGVELAEDLGSSGRGSNAVECYRAGRGLVEVDLGIGADVEGIPVDAGVLGGLVDVQAAVALHHGSGTDRNRTAIRQGIEIQRIGRMYSHQNHQQPAQVTPQAQGKSQDISRLTTAGESSTGK